MSGRPIRRAIGAAVLAGLVASASASCGSGGRDGAGGRGVGAGPSAGAGTPGKLACSTGFRVAGEFHATGTVRVQAGDHVGIREGFEDAAGRTVHATAGIAGEFGEGGRDAGTFAVSTGGTGTLYGDGSSWVLVWSVPGPCTPLTVGGSGFDRRGFLELLEATGVAHTLGE